MNAGRLGGKGLRKKGWEPAATSSVSAEISHMQKDIFTVQAPETRARTQGLLPAPERRGVLTLKEPGRDSFPKGRNLLQTLLGTEM